MFARLILSLLLVLVAELALLVWIARQTSVGFALVLVLTGALAGVWLARRLGWHMMQKVRRDMAQGHLPAEALLDGALVMTAAVLLIVPGVITDVAAILLLLPPTRRMVKVLLVTRLKGRLSARMPGRTPPPSGRDEIIDVRVIEQGENK